MMTEAELEELVSEIVEEQLGEALADADKEEARAERNSKKAAEERKEYGAETAEAIRAQTAAVKEQNAILKKPLKFKLTVIRDASGRISEIEAAQV